MLRDLVCGYKMAGYGGSYIGILRGLTKSEGHPSTHDWGRLEVTRLISPAVRSYKVL